MTRTMKKFTGFVLMVCMIVSLFAGVTTAFAAKEFKDVPSDNWAKPYVDFVVDKGYFAGATADLFKPDDNMTRGMFVAVIAKVEGLTLDNNVAVDFNDVQPGKYYAGAVKWATDNGIVSGYGNGNFGPNDAITREQICVMMDKYIQYHDANNKTKYLDRKASVDFKDAADVSSWAKESVEKCVSYGLIQGFPDGKFYPKGNATRAEVAVMIYRLALVKEIIDTDEYTVSYKYESATEGKTVPSAIPVPQDANKYRTGDIVTAQDTISTYYADGGVWTFKGWKENPITVQDKNIEFVGTWEWTASSNDKFSVSYIAKDSTSGLDITESVKKGLPADEKNKYKNGETVKAAEMPETIAVDKGTWEFVGFDKAGKEKTASAKIDGKDVVFTTYWKYTPKSNKYQVKYVAKEWLTGAEVPEEVQERCSPTTEHDNGDWLFSTTPSNIVDVVDSEGRLWAYYGNSRNLIIINGADVEVVQYWRRVPSKKLSVTYEYDIYDYVKSTDDLQNIGRTRPSDDTRKYYRDDTVTLKQPSLTSVPMRSGKGYWVFDGWDVRDASGNKIAVNEDNNTFKMPASDVTVTGSWKESNYLSVKYNYFIDGDAPADVEKEVKARTDKLKDTKTYTVGKSVSVKEPAKTDITAKDGTVWSYEESRVKDPTNEKKKVGTTYTIDSKDVDNDTVNIYGVWKEKKITVNYVFRPSNVPDGLIEDRLYVESDTYSVTQKVVIPSWNIRGSLQIYEENGVIWQWQGWDALKKNTNGKDVTFYGTWTRATTPVAVFEFANIKKADGLDKAIIDLEPSPKNVEKGKDFDMPSIVSPDTARWEFRGWFTDKEGKNPVKKGNISTNGTKTYYGLWKYIGPDELAPDGKVDPIKN